MTIKIICLAIAGVVFIAGCEEESQIDTRRSRLIANENTQLKKDLESRQKEIEKHKVLLEQCEQAKKVITEQSAKNISDLFDGVLGDVLEESQRLSEENERLKVEIAELRRELEMRKGPTPL